jgi:hypothetical protein
MVLLKVFLKIGWRGPILGGTLWSYYKSKMAAPDDVIYADYVKNNSPK